MQNYVRAKANCPVRKQGCPSLVSRDVLLEAHVELGLSDLVQHVRPHISDTFNLSKLPMVIANNIGHIPLVIAFDH